MALALNNYITSPSIASTQPVGIYTAPVGYNAVVLCAQATNTDSVSHDVTLSHVRTAVGISVTTFSSFKKPVASYDTIELSTGKLTLQPGDSFKVSSDVSDKVHIILTVLETLI
jgi:hypothetical protein